MLRNAKYTHYDAQDITRLYFMLVDLIREVHGDAGVAEFEQAYTNSPRRKKRFGLFQTAGRAREITASALF
jgi:hypothetical protein